MSLVKMYQQLAHCNASYTFLHHEMNAKPVTIGRPGIVVETRRSSTSVGWWENSGSSVGSKWDVSEERLPGGGTATECSQTPANPAAVRAARLDRRIRLLILLNIWCTMAMYTIQHNEDNYCSTTSDWMFGTSLHPLFQLGLHHRHPPPLLCLPFEVGCGWPGPAKGSEAGTAGR